MPLPQPLPSRLIGALFVERGLVSESQIRIALEIQNETGQQLGQLLVERFGVSRRELASVVAEQWAKLGGSSGPEDTASWRRLGEIFVDRGFVSADELEQALARQRQTGERLGEALVAQGVISKFELAGALAEQMAALEASADGTEDSLVEATVHHLPARPDEASDIAPAPVLELVPSEPNGFGPAETVGPPTEGTGIDAEGAAEPKPEALDQPEGLPDGLVADVAPAVESEEPVVEEMEFDEPAVEDAVFVERPVEATGFADPLVDAIGFEGPPVDDVALEETLVPAAAGFEEPVVDEVAFEEPAVAAAGFEEPAVDGVAFEEPAGAAAGFEEPVVDEVAFEEPAVADAGFEEPAVDEVAFEEPVIHAVGFEEPAVAELAGPEPAVTCVAFAPTTTGYRLVALDSVPSPGETIEVPDVGLRLVLRVGRPPDPGDDRICAFVEEPVTPAPVEALAH